MTTEHETQTSTRTADRALARALVYRLLSQCLAYPTEEGVSALRLADLPQAEEAAPMLRADVGAALSPLREQIADIDADSLSRDHRRCLSHIISVDCPSYETVFTTKQIFEETQELADLGGFYRAFGLELAEPERPDHISVELEFMHLLALKEAYARVHHTPTRVRLCRDAQRTFLRDHLGRWGALFAELLARKAGGGFYGATAGLLCAFLSSELAHLRVRTETVTTKPAAAALEDETDGCPLAGECVVPGLGASNDHIKLS